MAVSPEQVPTFLSQAEQIVASRQKVLGFVPEEASSVLFFSEDLLSPEDRRKIVEDAPAFSTVFFLGGVKQEDVKGDPGLVQRVTCQGGMLPGWKISQGDGDWVNDLRGIPDAAEICGIAA